MRTRNDEDRNMVRKVSPQSSSRPAIRWPAYMPTPVPTMLAINAVMIPTGAPSHQPTAPPRLAPRNVSSLDTAPYLLTRSAGRHAAVSVNESDGHARPRRDLPDGEDRPALRRDALD